jgi:hypothetical protein
MVHEGSQDFIVKGNITMLMIEIAVCKGFENSAPI